MDSRKADFFFQTARQRLQDLILFFLTIFSLLLLGSSWTMFRKTLITLKMSFLNSLGCVSSKMPADL